MMLKMLTVVTTLAMVLVVVAATPRAIHPSVKLDEPLEREEIINTVNSAKTTWVAGRNFKSSWTKRYLKNLVGTLMEFDETELMPKPSNIEKDDDIGAGGIPAEFDARSHFSACPAIKEIRDQGPCGSCWAVAVASAATDRLCIATKGGFKGHISVENLLSCCCPCAVSCGMGCVGGYPVRAWRYMLEVGVVTGGDYHSKEGCQPYTLPPCEHYVPGSRPSCHNSSQPRCVQECYNKQYKEHSYKEDLHKVTSAQVWMLPKTKAIQREIVKHGTVTASFFVYEDFISYKSGVYQHVSGNLVGGHSVRIIGWGTEDGTDYWLVANSWNTDWGDNGLFKIKRNSNECRFEEEIAMGYMSP